MVKAIPGVDHLITAIGAFTIPLHEDRGFSRGAFDTLQEAISICTQRWSDESSIPKVVAWQLCSLSTEVLGYAEQYEGPEREQIVQASRTLINLINRCMLPSSDEHLLYDPENVEKRI